MMTKNLIESVLPSSIKQLLNEGKHENLNDALENMQASLKQSKQEINAFAIKNKKQLEPEIKHSENLIKQIDSLNLQLNEIKNDLEENERLLKNVSEIDQYKTLIDRIEMINRIVLIVEYLQKFEDKIQEFTNAIEKKDYAECNQLFEILVEITDKESTQNLFLNSNDEDKHLEKIIAYKELKEEFTVQRERLWFELNKEWDKILLIQVDASSSMFSISIRQDILSQAYLDELTMFSKFKANFVTIEQADHSSFVFMTKLGQFGKKFLQFCQTCIISNQKDGKLVFDEFSSLEEEKYKRLRFQIQQSETADVEKDTEDATELFESKLTQLEECLSFLNENILNLSVFVNTNSTKNPSKISLMSIFSDIILKDFVKIIYEQLIINIIPLKNFDYKLENKICEQIGLFEKKLKKLKFLNKEVSLSSSKIFGTFVSNVEELYVRKKCKFIMERGRELIKRKDLIFEVIPIKEKEENLKSLREFVSDSNSSHIAFELLKELLKLDENNNQTCLDKASLLCLSEFSISKIAKSLIELVHETLNEAYRMIENAQDIKNISMLCMVAKNLFELYTNVVPTYYRENLIQIPLLSAVIYNDFFYLAFNCLTLTHQYKGLFVNFIKTNKANLSVSELDEAIENFSCLDLIPKQCLIGSDLLNKQLESQKVLLMQFLNEDCNGASDLAEGNNFDLFKKSLQKCILQLNNLSSVWLDVLPAKIYFRVFGQFFNFICNDLLKTCLKLEDISSDDASYLHAAFLLIKQAVYDLFSKNFELDSSLNKEDGSSNVSLNDSDTSQLANISLKNNVADLKAAKYIHSWHKFKYLLKILKANLQEIVDLWSDSKGPLALYFDPEEVRHLIRALFMITDRRSAALAKIK